MVPSPLRLLVAVSFFASLLATMAAPLAAQTAPKQTTYQVRVVLRPRNKRWLLLVGNTIAFEGVSNPQEELMRGKRSSNKKSLLNSPHITKFGQLAMTRPELDLLYTRLEAVKGTSQLDWVVNAILKLYEMPDFTRFEWTKGTEIFKQLLPPLRSKYPGLQVQLQYLPQLFRWALIFNSTVAIWGEARLDGRCMEGNKSTPSRSSDEMLAIVGKIMTFNTTKLYQDLVEVEGKSNFNWVVRAMKSLLLKEDFTLNETWKVNSPAIYWEIQRALPGQLSGSSSPPLEGTNTSRADNVVVVSRSSETLSRAGLECRRGKAGS
ncbi:hypothetical protein J3R30DRAFT_3580158 [Lentinula aciculospora]|uniref:Uncharacterized protein n=1 Tax=Lentinula aciculospora TaxID=153920 RepID=A0A9W8ZW15_9AGAR|nr:hypothetical protein J3R30DRAFT_3580158 [Lentinula aciculospora]